MGERTGGRGEEGRGEEGRGRLCCMEFRDIIHPIKMSTSMLNCACAKCRHVVVCACLPYRMASVEISHTAAV